MQTSAALVTGGRPGTLLAAMVDLPVRTIGILVVPERAPAADLGNGPRKFSGGGGDDVAHSSV